MSLTDVKNERNLFVPTREAGLNKLKAFIPYASSEYALKRNFDFGVNKNRTSGLSPYISKGLLSETEILKSILEVYTAMESEKFIQEILWRTYWKGWLEYRPMVFENYLKSLNLVKTNLLINPRLTNEYARALAGNTGVDCFDFWVNELKETGFLHNHSRMWFASIWIFTLNLPWELGADFFYANLIDADPASNTLSWRWVAGLHTKGKHYVATRENIHKFTNGRFNPRGLNEKAEALIEDDSNHFGKAPIEDLKTSRKLENLSLLILNENLQANFETELKSFLLNAENIFIISEEVIESEFMLNFSSPSKSFSKGTLENFIFRIKSLNPNAKITKIKTLNNFQDYSQRDFVMTKPNIGYNSKIIDKLKNLGLNLQFEKRPLDVELFPHAKKGYFHFKKSIPEFLANFRNSSLEE